MQIIQSDHQLHAVSSQMRFVPLLASQSPFERCYSLKQTISNARNQYLGRRTDRCHTWLKYDFVDALSEMGIKELSLFKLA